MLFVLPLGNLEISVELILVHEFEKIHPICPNFICFFSLISFSKAFIF
jgi:hypothetical protein